MNYVSMISYYINIALPIFLIPILGIYSILRDKEREPSSEVYKFLPDVTAILITATFIVIGIALSIDTTSNFDTLEVTLLSTSIFFLSIATLLMLMLTINYIQKRVSDSGNFFVFIFILGCYFLIVSVLIILAFFSRIMPLFLCACIVAVELLKILFTLRLNMLTKFFALVTALAYFVFIYVFFLKAEDYIFKYQSESVREGYMVRAYGIDDILTIRDSNGSEIAICEWKHNPGCIIEQKFDGGISSGILELELALINKNYLNSNLMGTCFFSITDKCGKMSFRLEVYFNEELVLSEKFFQWSNNNLTIIHNLECNKSKCSLAQES